MHVVGGRQVRAVPACAAAGPLPASRPHRLQAPDTWGGGVPAQAPRLPAPPAPLPPRLHPSAPSAPLGPACAPPAVSARPQSPLPPVENRCWQRPPVSLRCPLPGVPCPSRPVLPRLLPGPACCTCSRDGRSQHRRARGRGSRGHTCCCSESQTRLTTPFVPRPRAGSSSGGAGRGAGENRTRVQDGAVRGRGAVAPRVGAFVGGEATRARGVLKSFCAFDLPQPRSTRPTPGRGTSTSRPSGTERAHRPGAGRTHGTSLSSRVCARFSSVSTRQRADHPPCWKSPRQKARSPTPLQVCWALPSPARDVPAPPRPRAPGLLPAGPPQLDPDPNLCTSGPLASPQPHAPPQPAPRPPRLGLARTPARRERPRRPRSVRTTAARRLPSDLTGAPVK